jgi:hypothetical protein
MQVSDEMYGMKIRKSAETTFTAKESRHMFNKLPDIGKPGV